MTDDETRTEDTAAPKGAPKSAAEHRAERLKAALRDNLRRRKAQVRGRSTGPAGSDETPDPEG
ncbi:hypothetical protein MKK58_14815 [Methylobacterium sp. J-078]|uniref:hypothetical protein n=1 Tax=Methylobacterium sp. J-078 TaxID=2836657 RepID=UPI001FBBBF10|nr:hypothetical protein [Methylobacterium sp. J-078]MCJ2045791.1 hypothetical protein [Methylobacterium sp. J-078]